MSGLRLALFVLLTIVLLFWLLASSELLMNKTFELPTGRQLQGRMLGIVGLTLLSGLMFFTSRYWAKWFVAALAWMCFRVLGRGFIVVRPPMSWKWVFAVLLVLACGVALSLKYVKREPRRVEVLGLIGLLVSLSFSAVSDSLGPVLIGVGALAVAQACDWSIRRMADPHPRKREGVF